MQPNWAEENLETIRTLMERSAVYRRALAPIVIFAGVMGVLAAGAGLIFHLDSPPEFGALWLGTAAIVVTGAFFNTRRQAIKDKEPFWSPPTRRVVQALLPPLVVGLVLGITVSSSNGPNGALPLVWAILYGCALHSSSFFMMRGIKWLGWIYVLQALGAMFLLMTTQLGNLNPHWLMGFFFGLIHLIYGAYLYLTEKGKNAA